MWVSPITTLVRLANVRDMCLGVFKLDLEGCKQCVLGFDRERLSAPPNAARTASSPSPRFWMYRD
jgi:hypothetical protein